jgi:hypothetical protein
MYYINDFRRNGRGCVDKIDRCPHAAGRVSSEDDDDGAEEEDGGNGDRRLPVALDAGRRLSRAAPAGNLAILQLPPRPTPVPSPPMIEC